MRVLQLVPAGEGEPIQLGEGRRRVVGRSPQSDAPVLDGTVSREHAELEQLGDVVRVRDLGSTNGTFVNGARIKEHRAGEGDTVTFGSVVFRLGRVPTPSSPIQPAYDELRTARHNVSVIVKKSPVDAIAPRPAGEAAFARGATGSAMLSLVRHLAEERTANKLAALLEVAAELGRHPDVDRLLQRIVDLSFSSLPVERAAVLVVHGDALELQPRAGRVRHGKVEEAGRVPRALAYQVLTERVAILSEDVAEDARFDSDSTHHMLHKSAICVPLVGEKEEVLGILYLENGDRTNPFGEPDLEFMTAFAGLAALALEHQRLREREREEAAVLERLQRYLSPGVAAEVALRQGEVSLLRPARRPVVLLHCELHDFATPADKLPPADLAELLGAYLSRVSAAIFEYGGTLDNVRGHAVLALWGAPLARAGDADRALRAAMAARQAVVELGRGWSRRGVKGLALAAGITSGEAFVGDVSTGQRSEYAVVGTPADAAALLCAEAGAGEILASESFYRALSNAPPARGQRVRGVGDARLLA
jgi:adenylate cyclase